MDVRMENTEVRWVDFHPQETKELKSLTSDKHPGLCVGSIY
jgi:hypothetical protein